MNDKRRHLREISNEDENLRRTPKGRSTKKMSLDLFVYLYKNMHGAITQREKESL
jgi:hypothetical protein